MLKPLVDPIDRFVCQQNLHAPLDQIAEQVQKFDGKNMESIWGVRGFDLIIFEGKII